MLRTLVFSVSMQLAVLPLYESEFELSDVQDFVAC